MKKIPHVFSAFLCMILIFSASLCTAGAAITLPAGYYGNTTATKTTTATTK